MPTWEQFTRAVVFVLGGVLLVWAAIAQPARWGLIGLALVLLGVITGEQLRWLIKQRHAAEERLMEPGREHANTEPMAGPPPTTYQAPIPPPIPHSDDLDVQE